MHTSFGFLNTALTLGLVSMMKNLCGLSVCVQNSWTRRSSSQLRLPLTLTSD